mgnify:CR=1 FL=1
MKQIKLLSGYYYLSVKYLERSGSIENIDLVRRNLNLLYKTGSFGIYGDYPELDKVEKKDLVYGRWINDTDIKFTALRRLNLSRLRLLSTSLINGIFFIRILYEIKISRLNL